MDHRPLAGETRCRLRSRANARESPRPLDRWMEETNDQAASPSPKHATATWPSIWRRAGRKAGEVTEKTFG